MRLSISRRTRRGPAYGITTADGSRLDDVAKRQKQYAATMLFRVVAILVVVFVPGPTIMERLILGLVATIIPYVAVIRANGGPDNAADPTNLMVGGPRQGELPTSERSLGAPESADAENSPWESRDQEDPDREDPETEDSRHEDSQHPAK